MQKKFPFLRRASERDNTRSATADRSRHMKLDAHERRKKN